VKSKAWVHLEKSKRIIATGKGVRSRKTSEFHEVNWQDFPVIVFAMTIYVNNKTALRFWCMVESSLDDVTSACSVCEVREADASLRGVPDELLYDAAGRKQVLHVLVGDSLQRTKTSRIVSHLRTAPYPKGAFRRLAPGVLIASPELCFVEMAAILSLANLVELVFFFCGTYTLNPNASNPSRRLPLTTIRKQAAFIDAMGTVRGCRAARKALALALEGSASPRETKVSMLLYMPTRLGGYGIEAPLLNYQIDFTEREQLLFGRTHVVLDLYWPDYNLAIEYDGEEGHTDGRDIARDRRKSSEMSYRGITVLRVDKEQLSNPYQVYVLAKKCVRLMGKTLRKPTPIQLEQRKALFDAIMR